ncbi:MAG: ribbon-helix-helix domain-containing protein [Oscillospiraceae bacterium]|jgi:hypothetical protein|nr:ribbon-helix-helix domain-containing protein [Oscillospiraceae bacterium]
MKKDFSLDTMDALTLPPPALPKTTQTAALACKKEPFGVMGSLVFATKSARRTISIYLRESTILQLEQAAKNRGVSRSEMLEALLDKVLFEG